ncbi:spore germination protein [Bacillus alkalisoli]|uniref:spore germination protein n=1 Tax=Bacillus alkalisoli TaxID=2011008 RepID=UPI000C2317B0|nr:spore germination protein [Bacillus alkalisoli]
MECFIHNVTIESVSGGIVNFGNIFNASPASVEKAITGSGSANSGDYVTTNTKVSKVNVCCKKRGRWEIQSSGGEANSG